MKEGWTYKKLGEVATFVTDGDWIESKDQSENGIRLIQTGNVGIGVFKSKEDRPHFISEDTMSRLGCTEIFEGDCLVSRLPDPVGRACIMPNIGCRMITAVDCTIVRFGDNYLPQFFVDFSQSSKYLNSINNSTTGTTRKRISRKNLEKIEIPVPPLSEQQRIVNELDLLSSIIEKKKAQLKEYDQLAQSIFFDMFGDPVTNEKGWEVKTLGELALVKTGPFGSMLHKQDYISNGIPLVNPIHMKDFHIIADMDFTISDEKAMELDKYILQKGDVIFARRGDIGRCAVVTGKENGYLCGTGSLFVRFVVEVVSTYIMYIIRSSSFTNELVSNAKGATMLNLNSSIVEDLRLPLPPLSLQQSFASKIEAIDRQKALILQSITEVETLFNSRMDYYFN